MSDDLNEVPNQDTMQLLNNARIRIQELEQIIVGNRPDLFHDSLIRGSRVSRMEECISALNAIINSDDIDEIKELAQDVIDDNPMFGLYK